MREQEPAGDPIPRDCEVIEVHVAELKQLFNEIDPSPFRERDLDVDAEEFIVGWAKDAPRNARLALVVYVDRTSRPTDAVTTLREAVRKYFGHRSEMSRRRVRQFLRLGRTSLLIGLGILAMSL